MHHLIQDNKKFKDLPYEKNHRNTRLQWSKTLVMRFDQRLVEETREHSLSRL